MTTTLGWYGPDAASVICCRCAAGGEAVDLSSPCTDDGYPDGITCEGCGVSFDARGVEIEPLD